MPGGEPMKDILSELFRLKRRSLIAIAALLLVNGALYAVIAGYQAPRLDAALRGLNDQQGRLVAVGRGDVTSAYRQGKNDLETIKARIPLKRDFPRILGDIMDAASASGVALGGITYKPQPIKDEKLLAYAVTLSVNGSYAAVKSFLADVQKDRELLMVDGITLTNGDPFEEKVTMDLRLTVLLREGA
jgi:type IV pilus assembly protein PilO